MRAEATTASDRSAIVTVDGAPKKIIGTNLEDARSQVIALEREHAAAAQEDVTLTSSDPEGVFTIGVAPDGEIRDPSAPPAPTPAHGADLVGVDAAGMDRGPVSAATTTSTSTHQLEAASSPATLEGARAARPTDQPTTRREARQSFLTRRGVEEPARQGLRGSITRAGIKVAPSADERSFREWVYSVSQHFDGPRTIMIANGKGGAGKPLGTVFLSAVLLPQWRRRCHRLGHQPDARHPRVVHRAVPPRGKRPGPAAQRRQAPRRRRPVRRHGPVRAPPDPRPVRRPALQGRRRRRRTALRRGHRRPGPPRPHHVYGLVVIDSGNDETDPMWLAALDRTDQLVVPPTTDPKWCESASLLLARLSELGGRYMSLAENAVILVSAESAVVPTAVLEQRVAGFRERGVGRASLTIPLAKGLQAMVMNYDALAEPTKRAWLAAGASFARGL